MIVSSYEKRIATILRAENLQYETEVSFPDLKYKKAFLRFDFVIYVNEKNSIIIEVDGEGHFNHIRHFGTESKYKHMLENDRRKNKYCLIHKIELFRIPYWDIDTVSSFEDMLRPQYKVTDIWHNDKLTPQ